VVLAAGAISYGVALGKESTLRNAGPQVDDTQVIQLKSDGRTAEAFGLALGALGIAALLTAVGFYLFGGSP
jgi:hypothetical protein